ncbi:hypothetical protein FS749_008928 [Ceratobasidium sp. UAMH 11750]|nr:hypothetical protein FS749_008928 [Ceratobasidium sp. UAMH 11750]
MPPLDGAQNLIDPDEDPIRHEPLAPSVTTTESESDDMMFSDSGTSYHTMSTLQSNEVAEYFRLVHGFTFSSDENVPLVFPTDATADRVDIIFHIIVRLCRDGKNVPPVVDEMLRTGGLEGGGAKVLDLVTNSGTWVTEMASTYATPKFTSLDTKPLVAHHPHARIKFEVYDFCAGIIEPDSNFDLVHLRQGVYATKNFDFLLQEVHRVLKPNGFLMVTELPIQAYEEINPLVPVRFAGYVVEGTKLVQEGCKAAGADITAWQDMSARLDSNHPLWRNYQPGMNTSSQSSQDSRGIHSIRGFHGIHLHSQPIPLGAWPDDEGQKILGGLTRMWAYHQARSTLPMALMLGMEENEAAAFVEGMIQELMDIERHKIHLVCHMWTARKI